MQGEAGDEYLGDYTYSKKSPATFQKSDAMASQLAGIGEPFTSQKQADTRNELTLYSSLQKNFAAQRELYVDSHLRVDKMSTGRQSGMTVAHLVLAINIIVHLDFVLCVYLNNWPPLGLINLIYVQHI